MVWHNEEQMSSIEYRCGYCGNIVATRSGFSSKEGRARIYICPHCDKPTYFEGGGLQVPGVAPGNEVHNLPDELETMYRDARNCVSVSAFTAAVLACRKLLMNIAVQQGAKEGKNFLFYVDYLANSGFVPPNARGWVDHVKKKGDEATHEIAIMAKLDAEELILFSELLLKFIYEFPSKVPGA